MKKMVGLLALAVLAALPAYAQSAPSFEFGGGYTYRSFDAQPFNAPDEGITFITEPRMAMNGWNATFGYNFNGFLGVVTDFDMTSTNVPHDIALPGKNTISTLMFGPQIYPMGHHRLTPFAHVEGGLAHFSQDISGVITCGIQNGANDGPCTADYSSFAFDVGGGVDVHFTHSIAVRLAEFDYDQTRMFGGAVNGNSNQNNWKVKAGIIFELGAK